MTRVQLSGDGVSEPRTSDIPSAPPFCTSAAPIPFSKHSSRCLPNATGCDPSGALWLDPGCNSQFFAGGGSWWLDCTLKWPAKHRWRCGKPSLTAGNGTWLLPSSWRLSYMLPPHGWGDRLLALLALATWRELSARSSGLPPASLEATWTFSIEHRCCWGCVPHSCDLALLQPHFVLRQSVQLRPRNGKQPGAFLFLETGRPSSSREPRQPQGDNAPRLVPLYFPEIHRRTPAELANFTGRPEAEANEVYLALARCTSVSPQPRASPRLPCGSRAHYAVHLSSSSPPTRRRGFVRPSPELEARLSGELPPRGSYVAVHLRRGDKVVSYCGGLDRSHRVRPGELHTLDNLTLALLPATGKVLLVGDDVATIEAWAARLGHDRAIYPPRAPPLQSLSSPRSESEEFSRRNWANRTQPHTQLQLLLDFFSMQRARRIVVSQRFSSFSTTAALTGGAELAYAMGPRGHGSRDVEIRKMSGWFQAHSSAQQ